MYESNLQVHDLLIGYDNKIINSVPLNLALEKGKVTLLLGENSQGKSTLLRTLAGLQRPLSGTIVTEGLQTNGTNIGNISIVEPEFPKTSLTVYDILLIGAHRSKRRSLMYSKQDHKRAEEALIFLDLQEYKDSKFNTLPSGIKQKVMIAKAFAQNTDIILMDEPISHIDFAAARHLMSMIHVIAKNAGKTFLIASHDIFNTVPFSDNIWLLSKDSISIGKTDSILLGDGLQTFIGMSDSYVSMLLHTWSQINKV